MSEETVGQQLRRLRLTRKISQRSLQRSMDVGHGQVSRIEAGQVPSLSYAAKMALLLGCSKAEVRELLAETLLEQLGDEKFLTLPNMPSLASVLAAAAARTA